MLKSTDIAVKLKKVRLSLNLSQHRFAEKLGVTAKSISAYETGKCVPSIKTLQKISEIYGITISSRNNLHEQHLTRELERLKKSFNDFETLILRDLSL